MDQRFPLKSQRTKYRLTPNCMGQKCFYPINYYFYPNHSQNYPYKSALLQFSNEKQIHNIDPRHVLDMAMFEHKFFILFYFSYWTQLGRCLDTPLKNIYPKSLQKRKKKKKEERFSYRLNPRVFSHIRPSFSTFEFFFFFFFFFLFFCGPRWGRRFETSIIF